MAILPHDNSSSSSSSIRWILLPAIAWIINVKQTNGETELSINETNRGNFAGVITKPWNYAIIIVGADKETEKMVFRNSENWALGWIKWFFPFSLSITILTLTSPAFTQEVGKTVRIVNTVSGDLNNTTRNLAIRDPVYTSEKISAKADSHGEIRLDDNSRIIVGPGSEISLDDFVVSGGGIVSGTLNVAKGAFRFLSGNSRKGTFSVKTPLTTIGIRGTIFDVYVKDGGITDIILFSGELNVCTTSNICRIITENCDIVQVRSSNAMVSRSFLRSGKAGEENSEFSLISSQFRFPFGWQAPTASCTYRAMIEAVDTPDSDPSADPSPDPSPAPDPDPD